MVEKNVAIPDKDKLWDYIVTEGRKVEDKYIVNKFNADDIQTILISILVKGRKYV